MNYEKARVSEHEWAAVPNYYQDLCAVPIRTQCWFDHLERMKIRRVIQEKSHQEMMPLPVFLL
jgi:hypothetical protein